MRREYRAQLPGLPRATQRLNVGQMAVLTRSRPCCVSIITQAVDLQLSRLFVAFRDQENLRARRGKLTCYILPFFRALAPTYTSGVRLLKKPRSTKRSISVPVGHEGRPQHVWQRVGHGHIDMDCRYVTWDNHVDTCRYFGSGTHLHVALFLRLLLLSVTFYLARDPNLASLGHPFGETDLFERVGLFVVLLAKI